MGRLRGRALQQAEQRRCQLLPFNLLPAPAPMLPLTYHLPPTTHQTTHPAGPAGVPGGAAGPVRHHLLPPARDLRLAGGAAAGGRGGVCFVPRWHGLGAAWPGEGWAQQRDGGRTAEGLCMQRRWQDGGIRPLAGWAEPLCWPAVCLALSLTLCLLTDPDRRESWRLGSPAANPAACLCLSPHNYRTRLPGARVRSSRGHHPSAYLWVAIHSFFPQIQTAWSQGDYDVVVATIAFGAFGSVVATVAFGGLGLLGSGGGPCGVAGGGAHAARWVCTAWPSTSCECSTWRLHTPLQPETVHHRPLCCRHGHRQVVRALRGAL